MRVFISVDMEGVAGVATFDQVIRGGSGYPRAQELMTADSRARVLFGAPRPSCMVQGISAADSLAVFVGYHAAAGSPGVLAHTFSSNFTELCVNGAPMTEAEVNGLYASSLGAWYYLAALASQQLGALIHRR